MCGTHPTLQWTSLPLSPPFFLAAGAITFLRKKQSKSVDVLKEKKKTQQK
jgi:hypothetical protein